MCIQFCNLYFEVDITGSLFTRKIECFEQDT